MPTEVARKCPECGGKNLLIQKDRGEAICRDCGLVIEEKRIDFGEECREFNEDQASKRRRTGAPMSYSVDSSEPVIIEENHEIKIVKIGELIDNILLNNKDKVKIIENHLEVLHINSDLRVVSFDDNYDIGFRNVSEVSRHPAKEMFEIKTESGKKVKVTGNHSVF